MRIRNGLRRLARYGTCLVLALVACGAARAQMALAPNQPAPPLEGFLHPKHIPMEVDWSQSKVTLVNFWADWCEPCKLLTPRLEKLYEERRGDGLRIFGVYYPSTEPTVVTAYIQHFGLSYPILRQSRRIGPLWGTAVLPTSYLVDSEGKILRRYAGADRGLMDALIRDAELLLDGQPLGPVYTPGSEPDTAKPADPS